MICYRMLVFIVFSFFFLMTNSPSSLVLTLPSPGGLKKLYWIEAIQYLLFSSPVTANYRHIFFREHNNSRQTKRINFQFKNK